MKKIKGRSEDEGKSPVIIVRMYVAALSEERHHLFRLKVN